MMNKGFGPSNGGVMEQTIYQVIFNREDEDGISTISSYSRYFSSPRKAQDEGEKWSALSYRNSYNMIILDLE